MRKLKIIVYILFLIFSYYFMKHFLILNALIEIRNYDCDYAQDIASDILGYFGSEAAVEPMIEVLIISPENNGIGENLVRLHRKYYIEKEPYMSQIVNGIFDKDTRFYNRVQLVDLLEKVTGRDFDFPLWTTVNIYNKNRELIGWQGVEPPKSEQEKSLKKIRAWWKEWKRKHPWP